MESLSIDFDRDLDLAGPTGVAGRARIVVAMSGGVDSSVTAALLKERGYDVVGVTLQLYDHGTATGRKGACCAGQDIYDAGRVAARLGIPHYVLDYQERFRAEVMEEFAAAYVRGETPIPCVLCNQTVKFRDLLEAARDLGADALATGHYVRRVVAPDGPRLLRGADPSRDQSYFLFATTADQLAFLRFPLGAMDKRQVRAEAARLGLAVAAKPDSQDICFVPSGRYAEVVERLRPGACAPGEIVHVDGTVLGRHEGIIHYTVGQRRGLGLDSRGDTVPGEDAGPLYVVAIDADSRRVVVGPRSALARQTVRLDRVNWLAADPLPREGLRLAVKLRATQPPRPALVRALGDSAAEVVLETAEAGVAPGQACVFYDGDRVVGGGWIVRPEAALAA